MSDQADQEPKRERGRPVEKELPDLIPDTPENIMRALLETPPKREDEWKYLKLAGQCQVTGALINQIGKNK